MTVTEAGRHIDQVAASNLAAAEMVGMAGGVRHALIKAVMAGVELKTTEEVSAFLDQHAGPEALRRPNSR